MKKQNGFAPLLIVVLIALVLAVAGGGYVVYKGNQQQKIDNQNVQNLLNSQTKTPASNTSVVSQSPPAPNYGLNPKTGQPSIAPVTKIVTTTTTTGGSQNCTTNKDCLITAAQSCSPATGDWSVTLNVFGFNETAQSHLTIKGLGPTKQCSLSDRVDAVSISAPADAIAAAKAQGTTDAEIQAQTQAMNKSIQGSIGVITTCQFSSASLATILANWKTGQWSSSDMNSSNCTARDAQGNTVVLPDQNGNIHVDTSQGSFVPSLYPGETFTEGNLSLTANSISQTQLVVLVTDKDTGSSQTVTMSVGQSTTLFGHTLTLQDTAPYNGSYRADVAIK